VVVHCSAGIGRTGTAITLANIIISLKEQQKKDILVNAKFSIFRTVREIREQRNFLVQMEE
jgi:protein tyrosine phosphatase